MSKIFLAILLSLFISLVVNRELFVNDSPLVRSNLAGYIAWRITSLPSQGVGILASLINPKQRESNEKEKSAEKSIAASLEKVKNAVKVPVSKGVYAQTEGDVTVRTIVLDETELVEYTFNINGKEIKVRVPPQVSKDDVQKTLETAQ